MAGAAGAQPAGEVVADRFAQPRTPTVAVGPSGRAVVAWVSRVGERYVVRARVRASRTARWAAPVALSQRTALEPAAPVATVTADGHVVVAWGGPSGPVLAARRSADGAWQRMTVADGSAGFTSPAMASDSLVTLAWAERPASGWRVRTARLGDWPEHPPAGRETWREWPALDLTAADIAPADAQEPPAVAAGGRGDVAVAWPAAGRAFVPRPQPVRATALARDASEWEPRVELAGAGDQVAVGVGPAGHIAVAWVADPAGDRRLEALVRDPVAPSWPRAEVLAGTGTPALPVVAVNHEGYALTAWADDTGDGATMTIQARRRSGASGLWDAPRTVFDRFSFHSIPDLVTMRAVVDANRAATLAWFDPEGPGSATAYAARSIGGPWRIAAQIGVVEDRNDPALAADARGGSLLVTPRALGIGGPNIELVAQAFPVAPHIPVTAGQLLVAQRISQAAVRRVAAVQALLDVGVRAEFIRPGTLTGADFDAGVTVTGTPTGLVPPATPAVLRVAGTGDPSGRVTVSRAQLVINQRVSQAAVRRANAARAVLDAGITGARILDGNIRAVALAPGLTIASAVPAGPPPPDPEPPAPPAGAAGSLTLTPAQMLVNQRIAQAAVLRANWLVEKVEGGLTSADIRDGSLSAADLDPALRTP